ncbi:zinc finger protein 428 [Neophocaena asiaeorientalis asiaeorientalis]|uniref:Zinc finger protein 428 n=1 Tax=Neophocaena asiaeorientalis asiaeorientalis TaxID=1706337 RepID=A0A341DAY4_NEOAA|nr:zinc finger protein 428 [Neophocaena asiaeorientalis asiaeorientalis]
MEHPPLPADILHQRTRGRRVAVESWPGRDTAQLLLCSCLLSPPLAMTETREPAETGGYASLEEDDEDLSPGPEHSSDSEYTLSEPDSEEEEDEEEEEEETTDDPEYDPGYKVKQRLGGGRGGPSRRAPRAAQLPGPPAQPCQLCGRSALGEAPPGTPPCRLCCPATAPQEAPAPESRALGEEEEERKL